MSIAFATKLSLLRREKNMTQKAAADALGISQALLSHYENGIRECNLDFLVKAATYYDVTTDFLLGRSEFRHGSNTALEDNELESDTQIKSLTILRSILYLMNNAEKDHNSINFFNDYFSLSVKKYLSLIQKDQQELIPILEATQNLLKQDDSLNLTEKYPIFIDTVNSHSLKLITDSIKKILK